MRRCTPFSRPSTEIFPSPSPYLGLRLGCTYFMGT